MELIEDNDDRTIVRFSTEEFVKIGRILLAAQDAYPQLEREMLNFQSEADVDEIVAAFWNLVPMPQDSI